MNKLTKLTAILALILMLSGCAINLARNVGGTLKVDVARGQKIISVTWKETSLWVLTRPMRPEETPETYAFHENSAMGFVQGDVILKESK